MEMGVGFSGEINVRRYLSTDNFIVLSVLEKLFRSCSAFKRVR